MGRERILSLSLGLALSFAFPVSAEGPRITSFSKDGRLAWDNLLRRGIYNIESSDSLEASQWQTVPGGSNLISEGRFGAIDLPINADKIFYRIAWTDTVVIYGNVRHHDLTIPDRLVQLWGGQGGLIATTTSDEDGSFFFTDVATGEDFRLISPTTEDWVGLSSRTPSLGGNGNYAIDVPITKPVEHKSPTDNATAQVLRPTLEWEAVEGASSYRLVLILLAGELVEEKSLIKGLSFKIPNDLTNGIGYRWWVRAFDEDNRAVGISPEPWTFKIALP